MFLTVLRTRDKIVLRLNEYDPYGWEITANKKTNKKS